jgi:hypothetical protein
MPFFHRAFLTNLRHNHDEPAEYKKELRLPNVTDNLTFYRHGLTPAGISAA